MAGTPLVTSRLGFGTASLHHLVSSSARQRLLEHARDQGIRYFDTAPLYGHESAERELGRFAKRGRGDLVLATKTGIVPDGLMSRMPALLYARLAGRQLLRRAGLGRADSYAPPRNYGATYTRARVERSLRLLGTDYIDILYLHEPTLALIPDCEGLAVELDRLKAEGKVRHVGLSGTVTDALDIGTRAAGLAEVLQLEAGAPASHWQRLRDAGRTFHSSFGHFRGSDRPPALAGGAGWLQTCLARAVDLNPHGVIVFSARSAIHIEQTVAALSAIDPGA